MLQLEHGWGLILFTNWTKLNVIRAKLVCLYLRVGLMIHEICKVFFYNFTVHVVFMIV